jgi:hypothetical protein
VLDIAPMLERRGDTKLFEKSMMAQITKSVAEMTTQVNKINTQLGKEVAEGDEEELKKMMESLKFMKDNQMKVDFDLDQLADTLHFMKVNQMGKTDALEKKLDDVSDTYSNAKKMAPTAKKAVKPLQDAATLAVVEKLRLFEAPRGVQGEILQGEGVRRRAWLSARLPGAGGGGGGLSRKGGSHSQDCGGGGAL